MNIGQVAKAAGLPTKTVRYYAEIGLVDSSDRTASGYRDYDDRALKRLIFVRRARAFDFSIAECRDLLALYSDQNRSSADVKRIASAHLTEIERKQAELQSLHDELAHLVTSCRGDDRPDCPIMDHLG
jgi:Cu(I)-responsive transcriptional regulator